MNGLLLTSKEEQMPIEIMYLSNKGEISYRSVIVRDIQEEYIRAYCFAKRQPRLFKRSNILSAGKNKNSYINFRENKNSKSSAYLIS